MDVAMVDSTGQSPLMAAIAVQMVQVYAMILNMQPAVLSQAEHVNIAKVRLTEARLAVCLLPLRSSPLTLSNDVKVYWPHRPFLRCQPARPDARQGPPQERRGSEQEPELGWMDADALRRDAGKRRPPQGHA